MQELLVLALTNRIYLAAAMLSAVLRVPIAVFCDRTVSKLNCACKAFCSLMLIALAFVGALFMVFGNSCNLAFSEYLSESVFPLICFILIEFTLFLIYIINFYLYESSEVNRPVMHVTESYLARTDEESEGFRSPAMVLLQ